MTTAMMQQPNLSGEQKIQPRSDTDIRHSFSRLEHKDDLVQTADNAACRFKVKSVPKFCIFPMSPTKMMSNHKRCGFATHQNNFLLAALPYEAAYTLHPPHSSVCLSICNVM